MLLSEVLIIQTNPSVKLVGTLATFCEALNLYHPLGLLKVSKSVIVPLLLRIGNTPRNLVLGVKNFLINEGATFYLV